MSYLHSKKGTSFWIASIFGVWSLLPFGCTPSINVPKTEAPGTETLSASALTPANELSKVTLSASSLVADGTSSVTATVTLYAPDLTPVPGKRIMLFSNRGPSTDTIIAQEAGSNITDSQGMAYFKVTTNSADPNSMTLSALDETDALSLVSRATLSLVAPSPALAASPSNTSPVSPTPSSVPPSPLPTATAASVVPDLPSSSTSTVTLSTGTVTADGATTVTVTVTLLTSTLSPVSGKTVTLASSRGLASDTITLQSPASAVSDSSGRAYFLFKTAVAFPSSVTLSAIDSTDAIAVTATANLSLTTLYDAIALANRGMAYSVRRLYTTYSGPLLKVRRTSDNATLDIGATAAGNLDTAALSSFVGSGGGYVTRWYDQSGKLADQVQLTLGNQPRIMNGGILDKFSNGVASTYYSGGSNMAGTMANAFNTQLTIHAVGRSTNQGTWRVMWNIGGSGGRFGWAVYYAPAYYIATGSPLDCIFSSGLPFGEFVGSVQYAPPARPLSRFNLVDVAYTGSPNWAGVSLNGGAGNYPVWLGTDSWGANWVGFVSELVIHTTSLSTPTVLQLEQNEKAYFGTP